MQSPLNVKFDNSFLLSLSVWHTDKSVYITQYVPYVKYVSHTEFIEICQEFWPLYQQMKQDYFTIQFLFN